MMKSNIAQTAKYISLSTPKTTSKPEFKNPFNNSSALENKSMTVNLDSHSPYIFNDYALHNIFNITIQSIANPKQNIRSHILPILDFIKYNF